MALGSAAPPTTNYVVIYNPAQVRLSSNEANNNNNNNNNITECTVYFQYINGIINGPRSERLDELKRLLESIMHSDIDLVCGRASRLTRANEHYRTYFRSRWEVPGCA